MSPRARRLAEMRSVLAYWRNRTGPETGFALPAADMVVIADRACRDLAGQLIGSGLEP